MTTYVYGCHACRKAREVDHRMKECDTHIETCEKCGSQMTRIPQRAGIYVFAKGWESMNDGMGQYISQLEEKPTGTPSPEAHCRSMDELYEKAARKGFDVHRTGF